MEPDRNRTLRSVPDDVLLRRLSQLTLQSNRTEADLIAHIGEVDARRLYAKKAMPSMIEYCTRVLHLSEDVAYLRITVARAGRNHPVLLDMLAKGEIHLSGIGRLAPHLTVENRDRLLARARHKSKRQILELVAELAPRPDARALMRKLPERRNEPDASPAAAPPQASAPVGSLGPDRVRRASAFLPERPAPPSARAKPALSRPTVVAPLAPGRYKVQFTASAELHRKLMRLQALMRHSLRGGELAAVIEVAVTEKLERLESRRYAKAKKPRSSVAQVDAAATTRYIPAAIRRAVYERDGSRCRYIDDEGRRCTERNRLEFHHHGRAFARGGDHRAEGLRLMCKAHNLLLAEKECGRRVTGHHRRFPDRCWEARVGYSV